MNGKGKMVLLSAAFLFTIKTAALTRSLYYNEGFHEASMAEVMKLLSIKKDCLASSFRSNLSK